ncbi:hypothetical protein D3C81_2188830 [compost metagenome]
MGIWKWHAIHGYAARHEGCSVGSRITEYYIVNRVDPVIGDIYGIGNGITKCHRS